MAFTKGQLLSGSLTLCTLLAGAGVVATSSEQNPLLKRFLAASADGQCIESVTYRMISEQGTAKVTEIVSSALAALTLHADQQREMGCTGDIAAQAIAAGADPAVVLRASAAGL